MSSRLAAAQALQTLLQGLTNGANPLYSYVKLGAIYDPTAYTSWAEIVHLDGKSGPYGSGGSQVGWRIQDEITYLITSGVPYAADDSAAQTNMLTIQDVLLPALHSHYQLPQASNSSAAVAGVFSTLIEGADRSRPVRFPNGNVYLLWDVKVLVKQQYSITLATP